MIKYYVVIHQPFAFAFWAHIEIFRRFLWTFFRVENEHVSNTENYRATKLAPIPQKDISKWDVEIDEKFMAAKKISADNFSTVTRYFVSLPNRVKAAILSSSPELTGVPATAAPWVGVENEGKSRLFSELPEETKVLLLLSAVSDETMVAYKSRVAVEAAEAKRREAFHASSVVVGGEADGNEGHEGEPTAGGSAPFG